MKKKKNPGSLRTDLLLPALFILCVLPLITWFVIYDSGYDIYNWYSLNGLRVDLFSYGKSRVFMVIACFMLIILVFRFLLYRKIWKTGREFLPLAVYLLTVWISTFLSVNTTASVLGNLDSFENIFVLSGYVVACFYLYQMVQEEKDLRILWKAVIVIFLLMSVIGILQIIQMPLAENEFLQKLIMSDDAFEQYGGTLESMFIGSYVYGTLYNPNYAGVFFAMLASILLVMTVTEKETRKKWGFSALLALSLVMIWFTYSRAALLSFLAAATGFLLLNLKSVNGQKKEARKKGDGRHGFLPVVFLLLLVFGGLILADSFQDFYFLSRFLENPDVEPLKQLLTTENGLHMVYGSNTYEITKNDNRLIVTDGDQTVLASLTEGNYEFPEEDPIILTAGRGDSSTFTLEVADIPMEFVVEEDGCYYITDNGKTDVLVEIPHVDFHGLEYLGSGRLYIWSRTLPLLKKYLLWGSGPDTFAEVFPQNDYAGKAVYSNKTSRIIEKAHNDYLTRCVQTGVLSSVCVIVFYIFLLRKGWRELKGRVSESFTTRFKAGCLVACVCFFTTSFFNDSTLQTAPLFWVLAGVVLS